MPSPKGEKKPLNQPEQPAPPVETAESFILPTVEQIFSDQERQITKKDFNLPVAASLYRDVAIAKALNDFNILVNTPPKPEWIREHPLAKIKLGGVEVPVRYLPIERVEYLLTWLYIAWTVDIKHIQLIANSPTVTIRLGVLHPVLNTWYYTDGVGAAPINTKAGAGATEFDKILHTSVQTAVPAAKSYAIKDAAETLGKIFGKDLNRADEIGYGSLASKFESQTLNQ